MADNVTPPAGDDDPATNQNNITEPPPTSKEKFWIGFLLISFICLSLLTLIAYWPDRMPCGKSNTYSNVLFKINLIDTNCSQGTAALRGPASTKPPGAGGSKSVPLTRLDSLKKDSSKKDSSGIVKEKEDHNQRARVTGYEGSTIQLGTLLLILVAAAGFLGNMVHISSSLTTFIGSGQFKRSWVLWYCTKPFTASGLAIFLYFAMNGGSSSFTSPGTTVNLYVIMTMATLAGLFTDIATQKLKEVFTAIFKPSDNRPDKLVPQAMTFDLANIHPDKISVSSWRF
ncbi:MAG: hypothetical protein JWR02_1245 [Mucilaginibacter sp.]|nr:hypothetical protein [Mucilaginibacter sp.]